MESLRNEPVYFGGAPNAGMPTVVNVPGGSYGNGENGLLSTVILASLLGGRGFGGCGDKLTTCEPSASFAFAQRAADNSSQLLRDVSKSEGDIKEAFNAGIHRAQIENASHFQNLFNRSCEVEKEAIKAGYEARLESQQTKFDLLANQNANTMSIKDDIKEFRFETAKNFCDTNTNINSKFCDLDHRLDKQFHHLEHVIDKGFDKMVEREYKEEIRGLRDQIDRSQFKELNGDLDRVNAQLNRITCALSKVQTPQGLINSILDGCCG